MNQLEKVFNYEGNNVRTIVINNEPWFVAKDVADILGFRMASDMTRILEEDEKDTHNVRTPSGVQEMVIINESGLYSAILKSRKPEAKQFKRWITHEVLPSIRKTGGYVANEDLFINTYLPYADEQTRSMFRATLEMVRKQNEQIRIMQPKADYFDALVDRNLLTNFRDTAKELKIKQGELIDWLLTNNYIYRDVKGKLRPYAQYTPSLFEIKEWERNGQVGIQTLITPKGRETFRLLIGRSLITT